MPEVVVVDAVGLPIDLIGAGSVGGRAGAGRVSAEAGRYGDELGKVAAVHGGVVDDGAADVCGLGDRGGIEGDGGGVNLDDGGGAGDGQLDGKGEGGGCGDDDLVGLDRVEAGEGGGDGVSAAGEVR